MGSRVRDLCLSMARQWMAAFLGLGRRWCFTVLILVQLHGVSTALRCGSRATMEIHGPMRQETWSPYPQDLQSGTKMTFTSSRAARVSRLRETSTVVRTQSLYHMISSLRERFTLTARTSRCASEQFLFDAAR